MIEKGSIDASEYLNNNSFQYWINIFELTEFEKILYLDSDLYINKNIDELFDFPNMSDIIA